MAPLFITFRINQETGEVESETEGFHGKGCAAVQEVFSKALGKAESVTVKPEFHRPCLQDNKIKQGR